MVINRKKFFDNFPKISLDGKGLTNPRTEGFNAVFDSWDKRGGGFDVGGLAYAFATAWHETGARMQPVREGFATTDAGAVAAVTAFCKKKGIKNYAARQPNGRFVAMEGVGAMVVFLSSPAAQDITGAVLPIDGGWSVA